MPKIVPNNELELFVRHVESCPDRAKGRRYRCGSGCPIWCDGKRAGKRYRRSLGTDWSRAQRKVEQLLKRQDDEPAALADVTIEQAERKYIADCESRNCAPTTVLSYRRGILTLRKFCEPGVVNVAEVTGAVLERFRRWMPSNGYAPTTMKTTLVNLKAFFTFCQSQGWIDQHPSVGQKRVYVVPTPPAPLTNNEVRRLVEACATLPTFEQAHTPPIKSRGYLYCRERALAFTYVMLYTGIRISDATMLRRDAVDLETGRLIIVPRKGRRKGRALSVQLQPEVVKALKELPAEEGSPEYFFLRNRTTVLAHTIETNRDMIRKVFKIAKLQQHHTPHHFRDTFAKAFLMGGGTMRDLQLALGHSSITTTERHYAGFDAQYQKRVDDAVARISYD